MNGFPKIELNNPKNVEVTTQVENSSKSFAWYKDPIILAGIMIIFSMIFAAFAFYQVATDKNAKYGLHETDDLPKPSLGGGNYTSYSMSSEGMPTFEGTGGGDDVLL